MRSKRRKWLSGIGGAALIGGLALASYGGGIAPAEAGDNHNHQSHHPNPFKQILNKLDEVLTKLGSAGGGGEEGNYTSRWDTSKPSALRFTVLTELGNAAVRDNNTGLVWEKSPSVPTTWTDARMQCIDKNVGGTRGWRLPSVVELASLIDPLLPAPFVPLPDVFANVPIATYWTATTIADGGGTLKHGINFLTGKASLEHKASQFNFWCVRGSTTESTY